MTVIIKGHGGNPGVDTFVPAGMTLKFYSDFEVDLGTSVALIAIADGSQATPQETIVGSDTVGDVENLEFGTQDDGFYAKWLAMGGEAGIPIWWVGTDIQDGTRLCDSPDTCNGLLAHNCNGVLGQLVAANETEAIILACRGSDTSTEGEYEYGTDTDDPLRTTDADMDVAINNVLAMARTNPAGAEAYVDGLPEGTMAMMSNRTDFSEWTMARHARDYAARNELEQLLGHLKANNNSLRGITGWFTNIPAYGAEIDRVATDHPELFVQWLDHFNDPAVTNALRARPAIDSAMSGVETVNSVQNLFAGE